MQVTVIIPDVIPEETVNGLLKQFKEQLQAAEELAKKSAFNLPNPNENGLKQTEAEIKVKKSIVQIDYLRKQERLQNFFEHLNHQAGTAEKSESADSDKSG